MEVGELVAAPNKSFDKEKCPFCGDPPHDFLGKDDEADIEKIKSDPSQLDCPDLVPKQHRGAYGRARHHLIPAIQCFKQLRQLATMAISVGYDINDPPNGISLPTVWNKYDINEKKQQKFGDLEGFEKDQIRYKVMNDLGLQWHVGNHHYNIPIDEDSTENMSDEGSLDHQSYDIVVVEKLLEIHDTATKASLCEKKKQKNIKYRLEKLSVEIEEKLKAFSNPKDSDPYFVSYAALKFSKD